jgi:endonuclease/exonuclease/phosphatase family metal-dependent hydrolase
MRLKVLTWNIHKGFSVGNRRFILKEAREALRMVGADVVFLQEVQGEHHGHKESVEEWPTEAQFEYLADTIWHHHAYGKNAIYPEGHHGNAILSKWPIKKWDNLDLTLHSQEMRGLLHAVVDVEGTPLHLFNTHINLLHHHRVQQLERICAHLPTVVKKAEALIFAGDFNDWHRKLHGNLCERLDTQEIFETLYGHHAKTFPSFFPMLPLDRMYLRNVRPIQAMTLRDGPWGELSDHLPIYAEVEI